MAVTDYSGQGQDFIVPTWQHIVLGCTQVDLPQTSKDVLFFSLTLNKLIIKTVVHKWFMKIWNRKGISTNSFCWTAGSSSYGAPGIIHKLAAHLLHLASATRPWHCLPKGASVPGAVAATVSLKHHLLLHLCSHLTEKYKQKEKERPSWECPMQKYEYCLKHVNTTSLTGCVCSWSCVSSVGGTRGLYIGGGHGKEPLTGGAGKRWKIRASSSY